MRKRRGVEQSAQSFKQPLLDFRRGLLRRALRALLRRGVLREVFGGEAEVAKMRGELLCAVHGDYSLRAGLARETDEVVEVRVVGEREHEVNAAVHEGRAATEGPAREHDEVAARDVLNHRLTAAAGRRDEHAAPKSLAVVSLVRPGKLHAALAVNLRDVPDGAVQRHAVAAT